MIKIISACCILSLSSLYAMDQDKIVEKQKPSTTIQQPSSSLKEQKEQPSFSSSRQGNNDQKGGSQTGQTNITLNKNKDCSMF